MKNPNGMCMLFRVHPQENDSREGKNLEFTSSDEDSFLICVPCAPADAFFHHLPLEIDAKLILLTTEK